MGFPGLDPNLHLALCLKTKQGEEKPSYPFGLFTGFFPSEAGLLKD